MTQQPAQGGETSTQVTFHSLAVAPAILSSLEKLGLTTPTPIQRQAIPAGIERKDVIGIAQTGTGKTLAFGIPVMTHVLEGKALALVLAPTRELALQIEETFRNVGGPIGIKTAVLIGGAGMNPQKDALRRGPDVVIATPGRLIDHLGQGSIRLSGVDHLVIDEADRMLDMGFWPQIKRIIEAVPKERQTSLFSATLSREIRELATHHMKMPVQIEVAPPGTTADRVSQEFFIVPKAQKVQLLERVLSEHTGSTIVFTRMKFGAKRLCREVSRMGHSTAEIHGNRSLNQRKEALEGFKTGKYRVLVATDVAARGIDVKGVDLVINFDMPMQTEDYVHRIGRTARAGAEGHAISFAEPHEKREISAIERLIRKTVPVSNLPGDLPAPRAGMQHDDGPRGSASHHRRNRSGSSDRGHSDRGPVYSWDRGHSGPARQGRGGPRRASSGRSGGRGNW
jgi:ATP-dependent RNA helicase RhlE